METFKKVGINIVTWLMDIKQTCPKCSGMKKISCSCDESTRLRKCTACNGTGQISVKKEVVDYKEISKCEVCNGKTVHYCQTCDGAGVITNINKKEVKCLDCMGEGIVNCTACKGTGSMFAEEIKIVEENQICDKCKGEKKVKCNVCNTNHMIECPTCKGKGTTYKTAKLAFIGFVLLFLGFLFGWI